MYKAPGYIGPGLANTVNGVNSVVDAVDLENHLDRTFNLS